MCLTDGLQAQAERPNFKPQTTKMFGRRDADDDPFFGNSIRSHMREMDNMFSSFMSPFSVLNRPLGITAGPSHHQHGHSTTNGGGALMPLGFGANMFPNFDGVFENMRNQVDQAARGGHGSNGSTYVQSSVMSYSSNGDGGRPKYYEASSTSQTGPNGIRETRKTLRDSERGIEKMAIGHHIGNRGHVREKRRDCRTGHMEEDNEYFNIDEADAEEFDNEFSSGVVGGRSGVSSGSGRSGGSGRVLAIEGGSGRTHHRPRATPPHVPSGSRHHQHHHHHQPATTAAGHRASARPQPPTTHSSAQYSSGGGRSVETRHGGGVGSTRYARAPITRRARPADQ